MANDNNKIQATTDDSQIVLYQPDESIKLEVKLEHDTVWLNRQQMAQLFGPDIKTIGKHNNNTLHEELASDPIGANFATIENRKQRLMDEHDRLFPDNHIDIRKWRNESHDRWLIIDDSLYHCGHSLNANGGHKISAITLMGTSPEVILSKIE